MVEKNDDNGKSDRAAALIELMEESRQERAKRGCLSDELLAEYVSGCLSLIERARVFMHALRCSSCRRSVQALRTEVRVVQAAAGRLWRTEQSTLSSGHAGLDKNPPIATPRTVHRAWLPVSFTLGIGAASAVMVPILLSMLAPSTAEADEIRVAGALFVTEKRGKTGGSTISVTSDFVYFVGPAEFDAPGVKVLSVGTIGCLRIDRLANGWLFNVAFGSFVVETTRSAKIRVLAGIAEVENVSDSRFRIDAEGLGIVRAAVGEGSVQIRIAGVDRALLGARTTAELRDGILVTGAQHDELAVPIELPAVLRAASRDELGVAPEVWTNSVALPRETSESISALFSRALNSPGSAGPLMSASAVLTRATEREAAKLVAWEALRRDPTLKSAEPEDTWTVLRYHAGPLGDNELAKAIVSALERSADAPHGELSLWRALADACSDLDRSGVSGRSREEAKASGLMAARTLIELGKDENLLPAAEALTYIALRIEYDKQALKEASVHLQEFISRDDIQKTEQQRAMAYHRLSESLFFADRRPESVEALRTAVDILPLPRWKVHLASRIVESLNDPDRDEVFRLIREGLAAEQTYYIYLRALSAINIAAETAQDREDQVALMVWIADAFSTYPEAQTTMATYLAALTEEMEPAATMMKRAERGYGGVENIPFNMRTTWAQFLWKHGMKVEADTYAGVALDPENTALWAYYDSTGRTKKAIDLLLRAPAGERSDTYLFQLARLRRANGEVDEARRAYRKYIEAESAHEEETGILRNPSHVIEAKIALAELDSTGASLRLAQEALSELDKYRSVFGDRKRQPLLMKAQGHLALAAGLRSERDRTEHWKAASLALQKYLSLAPYPGERRKAEALLSKVPSEYR